METLIRKIGKNNIRDEELMPFVELIREGKTVIFPTETVYGLGANGLDEEAAAKIYEAKGRPSDNPLILHIASMEELYPLVKYIPKNALKACEAFWPGPMTIILEKSDIVPQRTSGGLDTVAIRMPSNPIAKRLIELCGTPLAAPSANISGRPSPTRAKDVVREMSSRVSGIIESEDCTFGIESTIIDFSDEVPIILRPGSITKEMLQKEIGLIMYEPGLNKGIPNVLPKAPGMKYKHYSPKAEVYIVSGEDEDVGAWVSKKIIDDNEKGIKSAVMCREGNKKYYSVDTASLGETLEDVAKNLFSTLIDLDEAGYDIIYTEVFDSRGLGISIMNRLLKSAGYKIIDV